MNKRQKKKLKKKIRGNSKYHNIKKLAEKYKRVSPIVDYGSDTDYSSETLVKIYDERIEYMAARIIHY